MIAQKQLFRHEPDKGIYGDCWRTAIACLLDLPPEDLPHVHGGITTDAEHPVNDWLAERGLVLLATAFHGEDPMQTILDAVSACNKGVRFLFSGTSRTGCNHVVIAQDGKIIHDPSLTDAGIIGPCDDGYWWVNFIGRRV